LAFLIAGRFEPTAFVVVAGFAGQFLSYAQLGPLAQESVAARRQGRTAAAIGGWAAFAGSILVLAVAQIFQHSLAGNVAIAGVVICSMVIAAILFVRRTDFTR
jgi:hypothetical protein